MSDRNQREPGGRPELPLPATEQPVRRKGARVRLASPRRFLLRSGTLVLACILFVLLMGYLRDIRPAAEPAFSITPSPVMPTPVPTPMPTPTPEPTPVPAPAGYDWVDLLVVLDAGHGGRDPGTCSEDDTIVEKEIALDVVLQCEALLVQEGIPVLLTRSEDVSLAPTVNADLAARSRLANGAGASLFVSIHVNSLDLGIRGAADVQGMESYYRQKENLFDGLTDEWLAARIGESAATVSGNRLIGTMERSLSVLRETEMPAVLLEIGYLTNREDAQRLLSPVYRRSIAAGVASAIVEAVALLRPETRDGVRQVLRALPDRTLPTSMPEVENE